MGHKARVSQCQESALFLPVVYLHDWYESVTGNGIPEWARSSVLRALEKQNLQPLWYSYISYEPEKHQATSVTHTEVHSEARRTDKVVDLAWCGAPAGINTTSPRNCTIAQPWTPYSWWKCFLSDQSKCQCWSLIGSKPLGFLELTPLMPFKRILLSSVFTSIYVPEGFWLLFLQ